MKRSPQRVLDEYWVASAQAGSQIALDQLARRWTPRLLRHVVHLVGSADSAPDVVQETWISVMRGIRRLDDPARFPGWIYAIATRRCADLIRTKVRHRRVETEVASNADIQPSEAPHNFGEQHSALEAAMATLPGEQRIVINMFYADELSVEEIAAALDIPQGTVKSRLFTARVALKTFIERNTS